MAARALQRCTVCAVRHVYVFVMCALQVLDAPHVLPPGCWVKTRKLSLTLTLTRLCPCSKTQP